MNMTSKARSKTAPKTYYCLISYRSGKGVNIEEIGSARDMNEATNKLQVKIATEDINPQGGVMTVLTEQQVKELATLAAANA